jgi:uncharacterized LabA/DUF88 family protein
MTLLKSTKIALFIDGSSLYYAAKALGFDIDYKRLLEEFQGRGTVVRAYFYATVFENADVAPMRPLIDWLHYNGFTVITKPAKESDDAEGRRKFKRSLVELVVDAMEMSDHVDGIVLFSGDRDFTPLVEAVQRRGVHVTVVSSLQTKPAMIADSLRRQADTFVELDCLRAAIGRKIDDTISTRAARS